MSIHFSTRTARLQSRSLALCSILLALCSPLSAQKPNIIVFFTDDHGYADLSCMGFEKDVKTPNIDRMAAEGARFTDGYITAPQCCPSRAALMTGRDQNRFGHIANSYGPLPLTETTIADRLGQAGYTTGMVGKWHLEPNHNDAAFMEKYKVADPKKFLLISISNSTRNHAAFKKPSSVISTATPPPMTSTVIVFQNPRPSTQPAIASTANPMPLSNSSIFITISRFSSMSPTTHRTCLWLLRKNISIVFPAICPNVAATPSPCFPLSTTVWVA